MIFLFSESTLKNDSLLFQLFSKVEKVRNRFLSNRN